VTHTPKAKGLCGSTAIHPGKCVIHLMETKGLAIQGNYKNLKQQIGIKLSLTSGLIRSWHSRLLNLQHRHFKYL